MDEQNISEVYSEEEVEQWFEEEESEECPEVDDVTEDSAEKYARSQLRVVRETKDYQLDYLRHALSPERNLINTSPNYQRRLRWPSKKRAMLIESFLLNIPIPPVFLFEYDYNAYEVIDGRQRLETIRDFLSNDFSLTGLKYWKELNRKRFNDLPIVLQRGLLRRSLSAVILLAETRESKEDDLDVRTVLFDRLNTGGIRLNPQELRNALHPGPLNALLIRLARSDVFTTTWKVPPYSEGEDVDPPDELLKNNLYKSMADAELVLRFFALRDAIENNRKGSLRGIMDVFMKNNANIDEIRASRWGNEYSALLSKLFYLFDKKPFYLPNTNRPSRPLYDALMIALSLNPVLELQENSDAIKRRLHESMSNKASYDILTGRGNTIEAIHSRVTLATTILEAGRS